MSRFGGRPDLTDGVAWPVATCRQDGTASQTGDEVVTQMPLAFVAQIALDELPPMSDLPGKGLLSFFLLDALRYYSQVGYTHVDDAELARVLYTPPETRLARREWPPALPASRRGDTSRPVFTSVTTWPQIESNVVRAAGEPADDRLLLDAVAWQAWAEDAPENPRLQMLGHPCGCEYPIGGERENRLLLSIDAQSCGLPWDLCGRNGFVFFRITETALRARRWDEVRHKEW